MNVVRVLGLLVQNCHCQGEGHSCDDEDHEEAEDVSDKHLICSDGHDAEELEGHDEIEQICPHQHTQNLKNKIKSFSNFDQKTHMPSTISANNLRGLRCTHRHHVQLRFWPGGKTKYKRDEHQDGCCRVEDKLKVLEEERLHGRDAHQLI